jgi:hypothetical protein
MRRKKRASSLGATPPREMMRPYIDLLGDLAKAYPGTFLVMLELGWLVPGWHPGSIPPLPVEEWLYYFRLVLEDPRLKPLSKKRLVDPNFYWEHENNGTSNIMAYDPSLRISHPFMRAIK